MKNLITTVMLVLSLGLIQQSNAQVPIDFGIKGGLNLANLVGSEEDLDSRTGIHAGFVLDFSLPVLPVGVESGVYYSQKGTQISDGNITGTWEMDYIEVPVLAKFNIGPPGPFSPHIIAGPYAAYNINSELTVTDGSESMSDDFSDYTNKLDFGGVIGLGIDFNLGITKFDVQAKYNRGLTDINKEASADNFFETNSEYNGVFSISAGIMF